MWYAVGVAESEDKGRCVNCGFLGKRVTPGQRAITPSYYEIDQYGRESGRVWGQIQDLLTGEVITEPICFKQVVSITEEIKLLASAADRYEAARQTFERDRDCGSWYPYISGFGPKEHSDKLLMEQLEERRMNFELAIEKQRQDFEMKLFEMSQRIQQDSQEITKRSDAFQRRINWFFFILALLGTVGTLLQLAFPDGIPWLVNFVGGR
jgi:hypothetical protein